MMSFGQIYTQIWGWLYLILVPICVFLFNGLKPVWLRRVLWGVLVLLLPVLVTLLGYFKAYVQCGVLGLYVFVLFFMVSIVYLGLWELFRRVLNRQWHWSIKKNICYGVISTIIIYASLGLTAAWFFALPTVLPYKQAVYEYLERLFC